MEIQVHVHGSASWNYLGLFALGGVLLGLATKPDGHRGTRVATGALLGTVVGMLAKLRVQVS